MSTVKIGTLMIPDFARVRIIGACEMEARVRYMDEYHFEMSDIYGNFGTVGAHVWANTEYEIFCDTHGIKLTMPDYHSP